jgi:hypothetical protein
MDNLVKRYKGKTTSEGDELIVKNKDDVVSIGFEHTGAFHDEYDPLHQRRASPAHG